MVSLGRVIQQMTFKLYGCRPVARFVPHKLKLNLFYVSHIGAPLEFTFKLRNLRKFILNMSDPYL